MIGRDCPHLTQTSFVEGVARIFGKCSGVQASSCRFSVVGVLPVVVFLLLGFPAGFSCWKIGEGVYSGSCCRFLSFPVSFVVGYSGSAVMGLQLLGYSGSAVMWLQLLGYSGPCFFCCSHYVQ